MAAPDYLVLGGGLAGCTLASRLKEYDPSTSVTLVEAGPDEHANPLITEPMGTFQLHQSPLEYNYATVPQRGYDGRQVYNAGGKVLSGSSSVNYAMWTRGGRGDYDLWGDIVGDKRWSYDGLLPFFRKTETHHDIKSVDPKQHGLEGPIHTTASARKYPLRALLHDAFSQGTGLPDTADANAGSPIGVAPYTENWRDGKRQPAGVAYGLKGVDVLTNSTIHRVLVEDGAVKGAELTDGRKIMARREVIISCGAIRTPQILMLSGIGPAEELSKHGIKQLIDAPEVGKNFHDHLCMAQFYKIKNPEKNLVAGSAGWNDPTYLLGIPADIVVTANAPSDVIKSAMISDGRSKLDDSDPHLSSTRGHIEILPIYAPTEAPLTALNIPFDGTCLTNGTLNLLPTSRGSVTLASSNPTADPLIDPNYYSTHTDRAVLRHGMRLAMRAMESPSAQQFIDAEVVPDGHEALSSTSSDEAIDKRVKRSAATWFHFAGSAAMGKVVDCELRVRGVAGLRVCDASVLPCPIGAHYQVVTYAIAEQGAQMITRQWAGKEGGDVS